MPLGVEENTAGLRRVQQRKEKTEEDLEWSHEVRQKTFIANDLKLDVCVASATFRVDFPAEVAVSRVVTYGRFTFHDFQRVVLCRDF